VEGKVDSLAFGGDGIVRTDEGMVVFVPFTAPGDTIEFEITSQHKKFARGSLLKVITPSADRTTPRCPYYGTCGGCQLQHLTYPAQLRAKKRFIEDALSRIANLTIDVTVTPADPTYAYRRHITLHLRNGQPHFYATDNQTLIPITHCPIYSDDPLPNLTDQPDGPYRLLKEEKLTICGHSFTASPKSFVQAHPQASEALYRALIAQATGTHALDLYCGIGVTSRLLTEKGLTVTGIDSNPQAISLARDNAPAATFIAADASAHLDRLLPTIDLLIVNPPRTGLSPEVLSALQRHPVPHLHYISCMPSTLARDLKALPYQLHTIEAFDLFPQTTHVETLTNLRPI
jgi:23S rRNA (uracil1939-C5)-methyltransferase